MNYPEIGSSEIICIFNLKYLLTKKIQVVIPQGEENN